MVSTNTNVVAGFVCALVASDLPNLLAVSGIGLTTVASGSDVAGMAGVAWCGSGLAQGML
jgi:hypothetical protein